MATSLHVPSIFVWLKRIYKYKLPNLPRVDLLCFSPQAKILIVLMNPFEKPWSTWRKTVNLNQLYSAQELTLSYILKIAEMMGKCTKYIHLNMKKNLP